VLTGETGAGKSILIDALQLVTGARGDALGCAKAPAAPRSAPNSMRRRLAGLAGRPASTADDTLLLRRTVDLQGKSRGWINGSPATATQCASSANS
jgi:DNA repair protein RecN (Recombination protein N)